VVYDFTPGRSGEYTRISLGHDPEHRERDQRPWSGHLACDDFSGYKALFDLGVTEVGCMAHARRKFVELHTANKSVIAGTAVELIGKLYEVERDVRALDDQTRLQQRKGRAAPIADALHDWMPAQRARVPHGSATAKALDYSLTRWAALTRYLDDPRLPIDNDHDEQQIRPWATGRKNWLFAGTLAAGQRAAAITSLIQSAKLNGHDPYVYFKDVLERLPTQRASDIGQLLPHRWSPAA
jgi:transposase